jgi:hypothetical protein
MSVAHTPHIATVYQFAVMNRSSDTRWIPADLVQNTAEYLGRVPSLLSFRGVSTAWHDAVSDAVGFLNGRCWTELEKDGPLWTLLCHDHVSVVARCAILCLARRLEILDWGYTPDHLDFALRLLGENNMALTALSLTARFTSDCKRTPNLSRLRSCRALKILSLSGSSTTPAGIRGLELVFTLEDLSLCVCGQLTDVSCLQTCPALRKLDLSCSGVTDAGIRGLELVPTLEEICLSDCTQITDVSCLQKCRALKILNLMNTSMTDAGIRGLERTITLEDLSLWECKQITDVSCLQTCRALKNLNLRESSVTDTGIRGLELIFTLERLYLNGCEQVHDLSALRTRPFLRVFAAQTASALREAMTKPASTCGSSSK